jgi:DNA-binding IclR family transcriptional regulator
MSEDESPRTMKTVEISWDIIEILEELDGARVSNIAEQLDIPQSTVSTHLTTLKQRKYVVKDGQKYKPSLYFSSIGEYVKNRCVLYHAGKNEIERLAQETKEYTHLVAEEYGQAIYLHEAKGELAVGEDYFSKRFETPTELHSSAYGKAILAHLPEERIKKVLNEYGLPARTESTITSREELFSELEQIREQGFALNDGEEIRGVRAVGAPIRQADGSVVGAISVSKPVSRMGEETFKREIPEMVKSTANVIEINIETATSEL